MEKFKVIMLIVLGAILAVGIACLIVCIGSGINGITFGEQICEWFGTNTPAIEETVEQVAETVTASIG